MISAVVPVSGGKDSQACLRLAIGDVWKEKAFLHDDFGRAQHKRVMALEASIGKSVFTTKGGSQRNNPAQLPMFDNPGCGICSI